MGWQLMGRRVGGELVSASWGCLNKWTALGGSPHEKRGASQSRGWRAEVDPGVGVGAGPPPRLPPRRLPCASLCVLSSSEDICH